jgi:hypothetical protein
MQTRQAASGVEWNGIGLSCLHPVLSHPSSMGFRYLDLDFWVVLPARHQFISQPETQIKMTKEITESSSRWDLAPRRV